MQPSASRASAREIALRLALFYGASFAAIGIFLPYWPVWLAAQGLSAGQIGRAAGSSFWPRVVTSIALPHAADRLGRHRRLMALLAGITLVAVAAFGLVERFWLYLVLSVVSGAAWAAILPLGEAQALRALRTADIAYGPVRLWGSLTFMLAAVIGGWWIERSGAGVVLGLLLALLALNLLACLQVPEERDPGPRPSRRGSPGCWRCRPSCASSWRPG